MPLAQVELSQQSKGMTSWLKLQNIWLKAEWDTGIWTKERTNKQGTGAGMVRGSGQGSIDAASCS